MDRLNANRNYDCFCGTGISLDFCCSYILENSGENPNLPIKVAILSDRVVSGYYYNKFENQFIVRGIRPTLITVDGGQTGKNLMSVGEIIKYLVDFDFGSTDWLIALGGGGILDLAGFASGVFAPGINLMYVPTTLNAMVEGAVSKSPLLNSGSHKDSCTINLSPKVVFADPMYLNTVPSKVKSNGFASVLRLAFLDNPDLMAELNQISELRVFLNKVYESRSRVETKNPLLLTLGNEISGAIEAYFRFMNYSEGEALALSLLAVMPQEIHGVLSKKYKELGLPTALVGVSSTMILKTLRDSFVRKGLSEVSFVDYNEGHWVIRKLPLEDAMTVFSKRISIISEGK